MSDLNFSPEYLTIYETLFVEVVMTNILNSLSMLKTALSQNIIQNPGQSVHEEVKNLTVSDIMKFRLASKEEKDATKMVDHWGAPSVGKTVVKKYRGATGNGYFFSEREEQLTSAWANWVVAEMKVVADWVDCNNTQNHSVKSAIKNLERVFNISHQEGEANEFLIQVVTSFDKVYTFYKKAFDAENAKGGSRDIFYSPDTPKDYYIQSANRLERILRHRPKGISAVRETINMSDPQDAIIKSLDVSKSK